MGIKYNSEDIVNHHAIAAVIKNPAGEILMQFHLKYGFWTLPVGKVKEGQDIPDGLKQEVLEECNLKIEKCNELAVIDLHYNRDGNDINVISHLFDVLKYTGEMKNNEPHKHSEQLFMTLEDIKKLPYISDMTQLYLEQLGFKREVKI